MKMSWEEWKEYELKRKQRFDKEGVTDLNAVRTKKMWEDPNIPDEDIPTLSFSWDDGRKTFVKDDE